MTQEQRDKTICEVIGKCWHIKDISGFGIIHPEFSYRKDGWWELMDWLDEHEETWDKFYIWAEVKYVVHHLVISGNLDHSKSYRWIMKNLPDLFIEWAMEELMWEKCPICNGSGDISIDEDCVCKEGKILTELGRKIKQIEEEK